MKQPFIILLLLLSSVINSFEVKVLLQKGSGQSLVQKPISITSPYGFVLSEGGFFVVGKEVINDTAHITGGSEISVNNKSLHSRSCTLVPALSGEQKKELKEYVSNWFGCHKKELASKSELLFSFFDHFVDKSSINIISYNSLMEYADIIIDLFVKDMIKTFEQNEVVSFDTLQKHTRSFVEHKIRERFLHDLGHKQLSRKDRKLLQKNQQYRYEFFTNHVVQVMQTLLNDLCLVLPRNILSGLLSSEVGTLCFDGNSYLGSFVILQDKGTVYLVNCLDIDDYLLSVIRHEGWPGWSLEVNKVLAVACRTYLVWQVLQAQRAKRPYHIENGIRHQTYKGHHKHARLKQAIDETKDMCLACDNKPILAMFDACCGGVLPAHIDNSDYKKHSYLMRDQSCLYCKSCKIASWKAEFLLDDFIARIQKYIPSLTTIDNVRIFKSDKAGLVQLVDIETKDAHIHISGKKMYSLFPEVKSFCFDIDLYPKKKEAVKESKKKSRRKNIVKKIEEEKSGDDRKKVVIHGKGYGHHVGLCQWGAMKLVKDHHWNYQKVLQFYYPGTDLIKLTYQR